MKQNQPTNRSTKPHHHHHDGIYNTTITNNLITTATKTTRRKLDKHYDLRNSFKNSLPVSWHQDINSAISSDPFLTLVSFFHKTCLTLNCLRRPLAGTGNPRDVGGRGNLSLILQCHRLNDFALTWTAMSFLFAVSLILGITASIQCP